MKNKIAILTMGLAIFFSGHCVLAENVGFVKANGTQLELNSETFYFSSSNQYYLFYKSQNMIDEVFSDAHSLGLNVFRTWGMCDGIWKEGYCFQPSPGVYDENTFKKMDYIIYKANQSNIRLIIPLIDNWDHFGGMDKYVEWSPTASTHDHFYTDSYCRQWYKNYVNYFLNRVNSITGVAYKDDPTIIVWELANEPRCQSDSTGDTLQAWIDEMGAYIKGIDTAHMVSTGEEGWYKRDGATDWKYNGSQGVDFIRNHQSPYIDVCTFHFYPNNNGMSEGDALTWIEEHVSDAHNVIGKPVYVGEFGWMVDRTSTTSGTVTLHDFSKSKEDFSVDWGYTYSRRVRRPSYDGNGSLRFNADFTYYKWNAGGKRDYSPPQDFSYYDYLSGWVYVPVGAPGDLYAELYTKSTSSQKWADGDDVTLIPGEWVQVKITPAQIAAWGGAISDIYQIGIQVRRGNNDYNGYVYYDLFEGNVTNSYNPNMDERNRIYTDWYNSLDARGADGVGFWILSGHQDDGTLYPDYDNYTVYCPEDSQTSAVIQDFSACMQAKSKLPLEQGEPDPPPSEDPSPADDGANLWDGCEDIGSWVAATSYSDAITLNVSDSFVSEGNLSFKVDYSAPSEYKVYIENNGTGRKGLSEDWSAMTTISFDLYNPGGATSVDVAVSTGSKWVWYESELKSISSGWNTVTFNLKSNTWKSKATNWQNNGVISNLNQVRRLVIGVFGYSAPGSFYVDDIQLY